MKKLWSVLALWSTLSYGAIDSKEYPPGHSPAPASVDNNYVSTGVTVSALDQMKSFQTPRFKAGHDLRRNISYVNMRYLSGLQFGGVNATQGAAIDVELQKQMVLYFNSMLDVKAVGYSGNQWDNAELDLANQNPTWPVALRTYIHTQWGAFTGTGVNSPYLQWTVPPGTGQYLDVHGTPGNIKKIRPGAALNLFVGDGTDKVPGIQRAITALQPRVAAGANTIDFIVENGEESPMYGENTLKKDQNELNEKANFPTMTWREYQAYKITKRRIQYRDEFINLNYGPTKPLFSYYFLNGEQKYRLDWKYSREVIAPINNQYYATVDFYARTPSKWRLGGGNYQGWQWIVDAIPYQLILGDKLYSPFVAAGYSRNEETNIRPAQWLGLMKMLSITGAEFFFPGFYEEDAPWCDPKNYVWQAVVPAYAQAITTRYQNVFRNGTLLNGDVPAQPQYPIGNPKWRPGYSFKTYIKNTSGYVLDAHALTAVRQLGAVFVIASTLQNDSNACTMSGANCVNAVPAQADAYIQLPINGAVQNVYFQTRRQGSVYVLDTVAQTLVQLDGWHEATHPYYWKKDKVIQAENFDSALQPTISTEKVGVNYDFLGAATYIGNSVATMRYDFIPKYGVTPVDQTVYVKVRKKTTNTRVKYAMDTGAFASSSLVSSPTWTWIKLGTYSVTDGVLHSLNLKPNNKTLEMDKVIISSTPNLTAAQLDAL